MFTKSENIRLEYCAQIVKIGELFPIEGSDFLMKTFVNGAYQVVVGKDEVKTGDVMVYCKLETKVNKDFLSVNNMFELSERKLNKNRDLVEQLLNEGKEDEIRKNHLVGYFNKHGRVKIVRLRGCVSTGCLFSIDSLAKWDKRVLNYDFEQCFKPNENGDIVPFEFDTINGKLFVEMWTPNIKKVSEKSKRREKQRRKAVSKLDRMIDGQFDFHYDTNQLQDNMWRFHPDTVVDISVKEDGTSFIDGELMVKEFLEVSNVRKLFERKWQRQIRKIKKQWVNPYWGLDLKLAKIDAIKKKIKDRPYRPVYENIYASRKVVKNPAINPKVGKGFYSVDLWSEYGKLMFPYLIEGMTLYGEIVGYESGKNTMIQKSYDYGCDVGENKLMPYRITFTDADGNRTEWNVQEVYGWTIKLMKEHPEIKDRIQPINILYHGRLGDLYPDLDENNHWQEEVLKRLSEDKNFCMEIDEPMCKNKVPREGIVIRIEDDEKAEAFKLKTTAYKLRESKRMDAGEVGLEMEQSCYDE